MAKTLNLDESTVRELYEQEEHADIVGVSFVALHDTQEHDSHGGLIYLLVVQDEEGTLFGGELAVHMGEGEVYEYPQSLKEVEQTERTVVVKDYSFVE